MSRIALIGRNSIEYVEKLLDIWNQGNCAVLIDENMPLEIILEMINDANVEKCFIEYTVFLKLKVPLEYQEKFICFKNESGPVVEFPSVLYEKFDAKYVNDEAVIIYSSGTTGKSKGIILTHKAINLNADSIIKYMNLDSNDCIYIIKSFTHSSTLVGELLVSLKRRIKLIISSSIVHPRRILNNIVMFNVTIMCLNPTLLELLCYEYEKNNNLYIESLKTIYSSGSILKKNILNKAKDIFKNINIYNVYGLSEAGPRVTAQTINYKTLNSVGCPIEGVNVKILDDNGSNTDNNQRGTIYVKTMSSFSGYVNGTYKNKSSLEGWINTGDIGYFDLNGELYIVGRQDEMIIMNSHKIYPYDIENIIINNTNINNCVITDVMISDKSYLVCLYEGEKKDNLSIIKTIQNRLLPYEIPKLYFNCEKIPANKNGKISRKNISRYIIKMNKELNCEGKYSKKIN